MTNEKVYVLVTIMREDGRADLSESVVSIHRTVEHLRCSAAEAETEELVEELLSVMEDGHAVARDDVFDAVLTLTRLDRPEFREPSR